MPVPRANDLSYRPDKHAKPPEWAWWEFDIDDFTAGRADLMKSLLDATDPDLTRFLVGHNGKLVLWHGWADAGAPPEPTFDYYGQVVGKTFGGKIEAARERARLYMFPGMGHCGGGPGPNEWDPLTPLVNWVEQGTAPDSVVARRVTDGRVTNERRVCAQPQAARYTGRPASGERSRELGCHQLHLRVTNMIKPAVLICGALTLTGAAAQTGAPAETADVDAGRG